MTLTTFTPNRKHLGNSRSFALGLAIALAGSLTSTHAQEQEELTKEEAQAVVSLWRAQPTGQLFERWVKDQLGFYGIECARLGGLELEKDLVGARPLGTGSWSAAPNKEQSTLACKALAAAAKTTLTPECYNITSRQSPFQLPVQGWPVHYTYLEREVIDGDTANVGGYCQLVASERATKQFFAGPAKVRVLAPWHNSELMTAQGPHPLKVTSLRFEVEGLPHQLPPMMAVLP